MYKNSVKRIIDILSALFLFIIFLPFWIIVPILIKLDTPGPVFYKHKRVGKNGKEFWLFKFRSMVCDADEILHQKDKQLLEKFKKGDWKLKDDPRITPFGKLLRNLTIDEFPQIFNVYKGDMSLVGPRAYLKNELEDQAKKYPKTKDYLKTILSVKPGITGVWQTSGRNEISFDKRAKIDYDYARTWTILGDILIMLKTPQAMISKW